MQPKLSIVHDTRYRLSSGLFPVRLRATFKLSENGKSKWVQKYYPTGIECTPAEFRSIIGNPRTRRNQEYKETIDNLMAKSRDILTGQAKNTFRRR